MKRLSQADLVEMLICPDCGSEQLDEVDGSLLCVDCKSIYGVFKGCYVLLSEKNELFPPSAYIDNGAETKANGGRFRRLKKFVPKKSVNIAKDRMFKKLAVDHGDKGEVILIVGCGNQTEQLEQYFPGNNTTFVFCDIDKNADVDLFCDSHELPLAGEKFDGVITTAVLEHVLNPEKVVSEMVRVLKPGGFIYSEIPFLQSVHEGAYDFTRFTMSGHRLLMNRFNEIDAGIVGGPGTALVWSIADFFKGFSSHPRISSGLSMVARIMFFWLKYFDYLMRDNPHALNAASGTYFYGSKSDHTVTAVEIISRYNGTEVKHT
jgi:SAM-dependent methyltransferase